MLKTPEVKHAHAPIGAATDKNIDAIGTKSNIVHLLIVGDQLRLGRQRGNIPNRTRRVYARRDDEARRDDIPIKRRDGGGMLGGFGVG